MGVFANEIDAARAYDRAFIRAKGRNAAEIAGKLNFPLSDYDIEDAIEAGASKEGAATLSSMPLTSHCNSPMGFVETANTMMPHYYDPRDITLLLSGTS